VGFVVTFTPNDYVAWQAQFPELGYIGYETAYEWYVTSDLFLRNDGTAPISTYARQQKAMFFLMAHLIALFGPQPGTGLPNGATASNPTGGMVGRVSTASEGSVSVSSEYAAANNENAAWYAQTRYGAAYWQLINIWRRFRYMPGPVRFGYGWWGWR
jgi:hypothetical protein